MSSAVVQSLGQTTLETYSYNGNGIRIAKNTDGIETRYLIDPNGSLSYVLAEYDADGNLSAYYTRGSELISRETSGEIRYYQYDPNGSVRLLTDASGDISDTYTFDAFGSLIFQTGTSGNSFLFQGEQYDSATGLYYLRARYMNPGTGTFTTMDAYQGSTSDPMSLHKYLFANANPVMYSDPSGYATTKEEVLECVKISCILSGIEYTVMYSIAVGIDNATGNTNYQSKFSFAGLIITMILGAVLGLIGGMFNIVCITPLLVKPSAAQYLILTLIFQGGMTIGGIAAGLEETGCPKLVVDFLRGLSNIGTSVIGETLKALGCLEDISIIVGEIPVLYDGAQDSFPGDSSSEQQSEPTSQSQNKTNDTPFLPTPCPSPLPSAK